MVTIKDGICTYQKCPGKEKGGLVDSQMRPWHPRCAKDALAEYTPRNTTALLICVACTLLAALMTYLYFA